MDTVSEPTEEILKNNKDVEDPQQEELRKALLENELRARFPQSSLTAA